jgi:hypothetical protein
MLGKLGITKTQCALSREHADLIPSARQPTDFSVTQSLGVMADRAAFRPIKPTLTIGVKVPARRHHLPERAGRASQVSH